MQPRKKRRLQRRTYFLFALFVAVLLVLFVPLPVYVTYPGGAETLDEMVTVEDGYADQGDFMLTTIRIGKANIVQYIWAHFNEYQFLFPEETFRREWESEEDYNHRQLQMMEHSQETALVVAYEMAHKKVEVKYEGVVVAGTIPGTSAAEKLEVGDVITAVNGEDIATTEALLAYLAEKQTGDVIDMTIVRDEDEKTVPLTIQPFPDSYEYVQDGEVGIGIIGPVTKTVVETNPPAVFETDEIGGPSAGLMFTLEIYNQLTEKDWTKGYQIAGTGKINKDGRVGAIGGIKQKVVAAHNAGAEIFFAPVAGNNARDAQAAADDLRTEMEIVPVRTVHDAIDYLDDL